MNFLFIYLKIFFLLLLAVTTFVILVYLLIFGFGQTITFFSMQSGNVKLILGVASLIVAIPFCITVLSIFFQESELEHRRIYERIKKEEAAKEKK